MNETLAILVTHQSPRNVRRMLDWWKDKVIGTELLVAYGGSSDDFSNIESSSKVFVPDQRLRTKDHVRDRQSYTGIFQTASGLLRRSRCDHIWLVEFDHIPVNPNIVLELKRRMVERRADIICYHLRRIDGTNSPHFLEHAKDQQFFDFWRSVSVRKDKNVILSMFASGSLWRRETFEAIASTDESFPIYQEIYLPTLAHHLGFRLCDLGEQNDFIRAVPSNMLTFQYARAHGALSVHPLKQFWDE
jgi:hypothetical protein